MICRRNGTLTLRPIRVTLTAVNFSARNIKRQVADSDHCTLQSALLYFGPRIPTSFLFRKSKVLALLDISPLSIAKCHPHPDSHDSQRWHQKYNHALTDSFSPVFRGCLGRAAAHGAPLAESGRCPQEDKHAKNGKPTSHFTPR